MVEMGGLTDEVGGKSERGTQDSKLSTHHDMEINVIINLVYKISSDRTELARFPHSFRNAYFLQTTTVTPEWCWCMREGVGQIARLLHVDWIHDAGACHRKR